MTFMSHLFSSFLFFFFTNCSSLFHFDFLVQDYLEKYNNEGVHGPAKGLYRVASEISGKMYHGRISEISESGRRSQSSSVNMSGEVIDVGMDPHGDDLEDEEENESRR